MDNINWKSVAEYVDIDTAELISKRKAVRDYTVLRKTKKTEINGNDRKIIWTNECEKKRQLRLL